MPDSVSSQPAVQACSATGVPGLDLILRGGLPCNRLYLLRGEPGVGKTTLALQYLIEGQRHGELGLYISLSETREEVLAVAHSHGWSLDGIAILELSSLGTQLADAPQNTLFHPAEFELTKTTQLLVSEVERLNPRRLVIDSLSELQLMSDTPLRYRRQMLTLKQFFSGRQLTVLVLDDHITNGNDHHVQSIAHGVMTIEQMPSDYGSERRRVRINKLRGLNFIAGYHDASIAPGGLRVFPRLVTDGPAREVEPDAMRSGIENLDTLLGGGIERGSSALFVGPAGTGKSTLVLQYATAAAARGERSVVFIFEENLRTLHSRASAIATPLHDFIERGLIELHQVNPGDLAPGQFVNLVRRAVEENEARVLIVDSLNGYLQAMPDVKFLNIQLHDLLNFLSQHGVVTLLTAAQSGIVGQMHTPADLTYLADAVVLLRYFEQAGRIRKAISVVKKRGGRHEETIRELRVDASGIRVGEPLTEFHGVLTGIPTYRGGSTDMIN